MGRAHTEPHLVPDKLAMGISSLLPQNIVISETIPGWCSGDEEAVHPSGEGWEGKREVWSIIQPKTSHSELGRTRHNPTLDISITSARGSTSLEHPKIPSLTGD